MVPEVDADEVNNVLWDRIKEALGIEDDRFSSKPGEPDFDAELRRWLREDP